jgi:hypothetical protein
MEKQIKRKQIFYDCKRSGQWNYTSYKWGEVKQLLDKKNIELQDDDELLIYFEEGYQDGDSARDDFNAVAVFRNVEETDEEFTKRIRDNAIYKEELRQRRYKNYLKLKAEFEPESLKINPIDPYGEENWDDIPPLNNKGTSLDQLFSNL